MLTIPDGVSSFFCYFCIDMSDIKELYADIALPLNQPLFTYRVAEELHDTIAEGRCVRAQVDTKFYTGIVWRLHNERPPFSTIRTIRSYVDNAPILSDVQMRFWEWMAEYYMSNIGNLMRVGIPSALKPDGFSHSEFARDTYKPPAVMYVSLHKSINDLQKLDQTFESLTRASRQYGALLEFISKVDEGKEFTTELPRNYLKVPMAPLRAMEKKNIFTLSTRELKPGELPPLPSVLPVLTEHQQEVYEFIKEQFKQKDVALLQGITGSGKTEIYIKLIDEQLKQGKNVLYLLPEIAMTSQLIERVKTYFGERVIAYHSRYSERHRVESYLRANMDRGGELILGVRSALFLPTENLGLVVVDEEHDQSYKSDQQPYYNARDSAVMLAYLMGAKTVLGSATPSLESYANAVGGKYIHAVLTERYGGAPLPQIYISDTLKAVKRGERKTHFNRFLIEKIDETLSAGEQVMLFQNRRGFSPYVECGECGWIAFCPNCNVALTLHKGESRLRCHYCQYSRAVPLACPDCHKSSIDPRGFGTEKVEDELSKLFPSAKIARLDSDTSQTARSYNKIIHDFERGVTDVLVGTQMITKGFDFGGVSLVGVLNADNLLAYPDFRASERAFQLMTQVAGRAGRREKQGEVVIQTSQPTNNVIRQTSSYDYEGMANEQLSERAAFFYPPYFRMVMITLRHRDKSLLWRGAEYLNNILRPIFGRRLQGPQPPPIDKIRREYLLTFVLKVERELSYAEAKQILSQSVDELKSKKEYRYISVVCNVDPQ